jgi:hypothetical protein
VLHRLLPQDLTRGRTCPQLLQVAPRQ